MTKENFLEDTEGQILGVVELVYHYIKEEFPIGCNSYMHFVAHDHSDPRFLNFMTMFPR